MITILLTDGEFTGMIRSLRERDDIRIIGLVFSENAAHRAMLDASYLSPSWDAPDYKKFLIDVINREHVDFIFPVVTKSLELMASLSEEIREKTGAVTVTSSLEAISAANDKARLFTHLKDAPSTAEYITDFKVVKDIRKLKKELSVPCVVKPVKGENKEGFFRVVSDEDYKKAFLAGKSDGLLCPSLLDISDGGLCFTEERLIMPYLPGQEWDCDLLIIDGKIISATVRKNLDMFGGLSACTKTSNDPRLLKACEKIVKVLGLEYLCCISFKEDSNGDLKLLEINPRAMGSIHVSSLGGNNLVQRLISILMSEDDDLSFRITREGLLTSLYYDIIPVGSEGEK